MEPDLTKQVTTVDEFLSSAAVRSDDDQQTGSPKGAPGGIERKVVHLFAIRERQRSHSGPSHCASCLFLLSLRATCPVCCCFISSLRLPPSSSSSRGRSVSLQLEPSRLFYLMLLNDVIKNANKSMRAACTSSECCSPLKLFL